MSLKLPKLANWLGVLLAIYVFVIGIGAAVLVVVIFPSQAADGTMTFGVRSLSSTRGLLLLAFTAGIAGSFLHTAQSLTSYLGNKDFKPSWTTWYLLRPWIGGTLGIAVYMVVRAGMVGGAGGVSSEGVNPYGVAALGLLGGWFSKTTTDKLQEVFETLFKTDQDRQRKNKLRAVPVPVVEEVKPSPVPAGANEITLVGKNFMEGAKVLVNDQELAAALENEELKVNLTALTARPTSGQKASIRVKNPEEVEPTKPISEPKEIEFG